MKLIKATAIALGMAISCSALAATNEQITLCDGIGDLAFTLMDARQQELDKMVFLNHPATTAMSAALIERAWQEPLVPDYQRATRSKEFSKEIRQNCLRSISI